MRFLGESPKTLFPPRTAKVLELFLTCATWRVTARTVRANWRVIIRFDGGAEDVDYVDYH
jgi:hypothetical protein